MKDLLEPDVYLVDVCGTLVREDTTLGLLRHHLARKRPGSLRSWLFKALVSRRVPLWWCCAAVERATGRHVLKHVLVRLLAGETVQALRDSALEYSDRLLSNERVRPVWSVIDRGLGAGRVVLASASLEPVVAALADALGTRYVASSLEHREGVLTGRYAEDLTGCKLQALVRKFGPAVLEGRVCAISDNPSDRAVLEEAAQAYVVLHRASHRARWRGLNATFLQVNG